ncbi:MAG: hypothetical protein AW08_03407 [Candidatus Accumulibacter adjunctus]|uniref:Uncharacterized protein n=1 Tax=Candidatus Accumulibacter adjunctus TaxID=1454001 RepID=A0A011NL36_9PROT|nr:MAG: hypothetical protein AW08_03407 [Candidatus Accumulibacter adjunctus]
MRGPGVMMRATSVSAASSTLSISTRSDAWMTPVSSLSAISVRSSSAFRMFSRLTCSPTTKVVTRSATSRTTLRSGVTMKIHFGRKRAESSVANFTGKFTAIVFGVTSPKSSSSGTITTTLIQPASASPKALIRIIVMLAAAAMFTSSLPQSSETIRRRGSSSIAWMLSE